MMMAEVWLLAHVLSTLFMFGLIWVVQVVHYPLMRFAATQDFIAFEKAHQTRISLLVGPGMLLELVSNVALILQPPHGVNVLLIWIGLGLIAVNWASTAVLQGPYHQKLAKGFDERILRRLVLTNWLRTAAWTARTAVVLVMLYQAMQASG